MKLVVNGAMGRMGKAVILEAQSSGGFELVGAIESPRSELKGTFLDEILGSAYPHLKVTGGWHESFRRADVVIDFSLPEGTMQILPHLNRFGIPLVSGTTGLSDEEWRRLTEASKEIAIFHSPNMSVGMYVMSQATRIVAERLPESWDFELIEVHHKMKKDYPSGTALQMSSTVSKIRHKKVEDSPEGTRIHSLRIGDVPGRHLAMFAGRGEVVELCHNVHSRAAFANGSLVAARFIKDKEPGFYSMDDIFAGLE
ncbi:MAG: 4-hydroxy-tetrahydrodipicolinate reductase [Candidatus Glassbacteria bacterium]